MMKVRGLDSACLAETVEMLRSLFPIQTQPEVASQAAESLAFGCCLGFQMHLSVECHSMNNK